MRYLLQFADQYDPRGPDRQGRNRLRVDARWPLDRCALRPKTKQAALDTARGLARYGSITAYEICVGNDCDACRVNSERDEWRSSFLVSEDKQRGGVWLMGSHEPDAQGRYFPSWESLIRNTELPVLERIIDPHWGQIYVEAGRAGEE